jgi:hypothetical protein
MIQQHHCINTTTTEPHTIVWWWRIPLYHTCLQRQSSMAFRSYSCFRYWTASSVVAIVYWAVWFMPQHLALAQEGGGGNVTIGCYTNLTELYEQLLEDKYFEQREYTLCPNTTFTIGNIDLDTGFCCIGGQRFLAAAPRTTIKCGEDGKSTNNCIMVGGNLQYSNTAAIWNEPSIPDAVIMGVTFQSTGFLGASLASRGDITFIDCVWEVSIYV